MCRSQANYCGNFNCSLKYSVRSILDLFQGIGTMFAQSPQIAIARVVLIFLGFLLVYLGVKGTLEPLIMVPMGLGMSAVNAGVLFLGENQIGNLIIDPLLSTTDELMTYMQINFLQPIYNLTFSNGLIACLVFMGIGILCDIGYVLEHPFISMTIALFAELGTVATYPIARAMGLDAGSSAAVSIIGGYVVYFFKKGVQSDGWHRRCVVCAVYGEGCTEGCCKGKSGSIYSGLCSWREYLRRYHNGNPDRYLYYVT